MFKNKFFSWFHIHKNKSNKKDNNDAIKNKHKIISDHSCKCNKKKNVYVKNNESDTKCIMVSQNDNIYHNAKENKIINSVSNVSKNLELFNQNNFLENPKEKNNSDVLLKKNSFFSILAKKLIKTKVSFGVKLKNLFFKKELNSSLFKEIEEKLLMSDLGVETTQELIDTLSNNITREKLKDANLVFQILKDTMRNILYKVEQPLNFNHKKLFIIFVVGINGVGKTSIIGKLSEQYKKNGKSVMLVAADTFRAAAIDQLKFFGDKNSIPVICRAPGSDPASVVYDALVSAKCNEIDILMIDTAGRMHNKCNLMKELNKIKSVIRKVDCSLPNEIMLVLDACIGQNSIRQAEIFNEVLNITGLVITKLDGTAKGGILFSIAKKLSIPIRYISFGENSDDIQIFNSENFVNAIFDNGIVK